MISLETQYLGMTLANPLVVSSSGLTNSVDKVVNLAKEGVGAVVLKSLFEEQIMAEASQTLNNTEGQYPEALDYVQTYVRSQSVAAYLELIRGCKEKTSIPVIASINCFSAGEWTNFAKSIEEAGADAIELNIFSLNTGIHQNSEEYEQTYYKIVREVKKVVNIPIAVKLSFYFSNLVHVIDRLKAEGAESVVLFNRFYQPDINIQSLKVTAADVFSVPSDQFQTLRWSSIVSGVTKMDVSASTGVHDYDAVIKMLLAGAQTVQLCSAIYQQGKEILSQILVCMEEWMEQKNFDTVDEFRGLMDYRSIQDPSLYERNQFMKYYSARE